MAIRCKDCVHHLDEQQIRELTGEYGVEITTIFNDSRPYVAANLKKGEKVIFCMWSYSVMGDQSVCADVEEDGNDE